MHELPYARVCVCVLCAGLAGFTFVSYVCACCSILHISGAVCMHHTALIATWPGAAYKQRSTCVA